MFAEVVPIIDQRRMFGFLVIGESRVAELTARLVGASTVFYIEPRPQDEWLVVARDEPHIRTIAAEFGASHEALEANRA